MSDEINNKDSKPESTKGEQRHSEKRRKALRNITVASGVAAVGAGQKWTKPVVDSVITPAHAQASDPDPGPPPPLGSISATWFLGDDAPGSYDTGVTGNQTITDSFLYDDGTDMRVNATVTPAAAIPLTVTVDGGSTSFGAVDSPIPVTMTSDAGNADFGTFEPTNGDFGDSPGTGTITVTVSSPGYTSAVITLNVS